MKALTVRQPWASLIANGTKLTETRSWRTPYRGELAIHAAKGWTVDEMRYALDLMSRGTLRADHLRDLPRGAVIATVELVACIPTEDVWSDEYGDFTPGRWAWVLGGLRTFDPIPAVGRLGLWDWPG